jgi:hypothetical protein
MLTPSEAGYEVNAKYRVADSEIGPMCVSSTPAALSPARAVMRRIIVVVTPPRSIVMLALRLDIRGRWRSQAVGLRIFHCARQACS